MDEFFKINKENKDEHKIHKDRLFPKINGVNVNALKIDWDCVSFVTPPYNSRKIVEITTKHVKKYKPSLKDVVAVDATACVGCDTIMLCSTFGKVITIELDQDRYNNLVHNINQYKFTNVELLCGDSTTIIPNLPMVDIISVDVPWGGKGYDLKQNLRLDFGSCSLEQFIVNCFDKQISQCPTKILVSKMPKNYDIEYLYKTLSDEFDITLYDQLKKMNVIVVEKKLKINTSNNLITNGNITPTNEKVINLDNTITSVVSTVVSNIINQAIINATKTLTNCSYCNYYNNCNEIWDSTEDFCLNIPNTKTKLN